MDCWDRIWVSPRGVPPAHSGSTLSGHARLILQSPLTAFHARHYNGQPVTSMPTPFDQHLLLQPPQQQHLLSMQRVMPLGQPAVQHPDVTAPLSIVVNKVRVSVCGGMGAQQISRCGE
jgi:hypothetical protein